MKLIDADVLKHMVTEGADKAPEGIQLIYIECVQKIKQAILECIDKIPDKKVVPRKYHEDCLALAEERCIAQMQKRREAEMTFKNSAPAHYGRWERLDETHSPDCVGRHCCSLCHELAKEWRGREQLTNYCPRCGAKMDEQEDCP